MQPSTARGGRCQVVANLKIYWPQRGRRAKLPVPKTDTPILIWQQSGKLGHFDWLASQILPYQYLYHIFSPIPNSYHNYMLLV